MAPQSCGLAFFLVVQTNLVGSRQFDMNNFLTKVKKHPLSKFGTIYVDIFLHDQAVVSEIKFITQSLFTVLKEGQSI